MSDLWILAGQSNMEGCGKMTDIEQPGPNIRSFAQGDNWKIAEEQLHWLIEAVDDVHHPGIVGEELEAARRQYRIERNTGSGLGLTFAKTVSENAGIDIDLLPTAHGGTSMSQWSPDLKHLGGGSFYGTLLRRTQLALETGGDTQLRGILWYQGESDADAENSPLYLQRMIRLIEALRKDLSAPNLPFYLVQLGCWAADVPGGDPASIGWNTVREAQRILPSLVPNTAAVPAIDLDLDDGIHIATNGLKRLGRRLANIALNELYAVPSPTGPQLKSVTLEENTIRVSYSGVSGGLKTPDAAKRVFGYSLDLGNGKPTPNPIFRSYIDLESPTDVLLFTEHPITPNVKLYYGEGVFPHCQLADQSDMAALAFGPEDLA
jgi:sialate O-acetylesterase